LAFLFSRKIIFSYNGRNANKFLKGVDIMIYRIKTNGSGYRTLKIKKGTNDVVFLLTDKGFDALTERLVASGTRMFNLMENQLRLYMTPEEFYRFRETCRLDVGLIQKEAENWIDLNIREL
jgi:hypothetical protein